MLLFGFASNIKQASIGIMKRWLSLSLSLLSASSYKIMLQTSVSFLAQTKEIIKYNEAEHSSLKEYHLCLEQNHFQDKDQ